MANFSLSKLSANLAVQSVATTIIIGKVVANAGASFIKEVKNEVVSRQEAEEEIQDILEPSTEVIDDPETGQRTVTIRRGDVEC